MKPEPLDQHTPEKRVKIKRSDGSTQYVTAGELAALNEKNKVIRELRNSHKKNRQLKLMLFFSWILFLGVTAFYYAIYSSKDNPGIQKTVNTTNLTKSNDLNAAPLNDMPITKNASQDADTIGTKRKEITSTNTTETESKPPGNITGHTESPRTTYYKHDIVQTIHDWARAWSSQDVERYLAFYSQQFSPENSSMSYQQWADNRKTRLQKPDWITVNITDIEIIGPDESGNMTTRFRQDYLTNSYQDSTLKELILTREDNAWLILRESSIKQLPEQSY